MALMKRPNSAAVAPLTRPNDAWRWRLTTPAMAPNGAQRRPLPETALEGAPEARATSAPEERTSNAPETRTSAPEARTSAPEAPPRNGVGSRGCSAPETRRLKCLDWCLNVVGETP